MDLHRDSPKPPRIAEWLTALFVPANVAEAVTGDLQEEFSRLAISSGATCAKAWYRRQATSTILRSGPTAFRNAPVRLVIALAGGLWLIGFATRYATHAMQTLLDAQRVYEVNPIAYLFWLKFPLEIGRTIICMAVGSLVAIAAKRYELPAAVSLALAQIAMFVAGAITLIAYGRHWLDWFTVMAPWNVLCSVTTVVGAVMVRLYRQTATVRGSDA
jgi:hypothetical protein